MNPNKEATRVGNGPTEIVLTGGPCAGKTTALSFLQEKLMDRGFRVFIVPEVATTFITGGLYDLGRIAAEDQVKFFEIQKQILMMQMAYRERFINLASLFPDEDCILIYDRGPMDSKAYLPEEDADELMRALLKETKYNWDEVRDSFDGVIHLVTAADGAEEFFTTENNEAREETPEEARYLDQRTRDAWVGHSTFRIIDNSTDFEGKMKRTLKAVSTILGIPVPLEIERKFLLDEVPDFDSEDFDNVAEVSLEQMYLDAGSDDEEVRIRKRTQDGHTIYYKTTKKGSPPRRQETEKRIKAPDYREQKKLRIEGTGVIRKKRYCFVYKSQYFELDVFEKPEGLVLLEVELTEENADVDLPPFLEVDEEVTENPRFKNSEISRRIT